jgi:acyl carrier protein
MTDGEAAVRERIVRIVSVVTREPIEGAGDVSRTAMASWDSLAHVEILFTIEETFGIEFDEDAMRNSDSADSLASEVIRLGGTVT